MTDAEIQKLIDDAKQATQGKWLPEHSKVTRVFHDSGDRLFTCDGGYGTSYGKNQWKDAQHIANTCPARIVPLLEELLELRKVNEHNIKGMKEGLIIASNVAFVVSHVGRVEP